MSPEYLKEWVEKAEQDYQAVMLLSRQRKRSLPDIICFHAHQCIEKYLKALLAKHGHKIQKTHDIVFLVDQLKQVEPELELLRDVLRKLNRYAVEFRYPGEGATRHEAKWAVKQIKEIRKIFLPKV